MDDARREFDVEPGNQAHIDLAKAGVTEPTIEVLEEELAAARAVRAMTVGRLSGEVEGKPTHSGNFLQRIDALREIERQHGEMLATLKRLLVDGNGNGYGYGYGDENDN